MRAEPESLARLAARAQLGDRAALEELLRRLAEQLRPYLAHLTGDTDQAEDLLQEVLLRVTRRLPTLREHAFVRAWAFRIATRDALRHIARRGRHAHLALDAVPELPAAADDEPPFDPAILERLPAAIAELPEASRSVVRLHYLDGFTQPEVAAILSIPVGTVKSRIAYALRLLRTRIERPDT